MKVAVTGVGGGVGQSIVKALQDTDYRTVGIDSEVLAAGLYATGTSYVGLPAKDPGYLARLVEICRRENASVLFPGLDAELLPLARGRDELKDEGITAVISDPRVVEIADDKLRTQEFLQREGFPSIPTFPLDGYHGQLEFPVVLKPRKGGARSIGLLHARNLAEFDDHAARVDKSNYVVQEYVAGDEYTCGTVSLGRGCLGVIVMRRQLRFGDTYKAFVELNPAVTDYVRQVIDKLGPFGPCNVQLRLRDGKPMIFEFNARCSGTTAARALAGFNEPEMTCDFLSKKVESPRFQIREIAILRYWKELVVPYEEIHQLESTGSLTHDARNL